MKKSDYIVRKQAIKRELEMADRRKREPSFPNGLGNTVTGTIYDCNRASFERALKAYWDKLYVGWNPFKKDGYGCWEVWQQPTQKTPVLRYLDKKTDTKIYTLEFVLSDYLHWVADLDYLDMAFIGKLRSMDAWEDKQLTAKHDDAYIQHEIDLEKQEDENIKYVVKHNKQVFIF